MCGAVAHVVVVCRSGRPGARQHRLVRLVPGSGSFRPHTAQPRSPAIQIQPDHVGDLATSSVGENLNVSARHGWMPYSRHALATAEKLTSDDRPADANSNASHRVCRRWYQRSRHDLAMIELPWPARACRSANPTIPIPHTGLASRSPSAATPRARDLCWTSRQRPATRCEPAAQPRSHRRGPRQRHHFSRPLPQCHSATRIHDYPKSLPSNYFRHAHYGCPTRLIRSTN